MLRRLGFLFSSLQAVSSVLLLGASALLISTAAEHPPVMLLMTMVVMVRAFAIGRAAFRYGERLALHDHAFRKLARLRVSVYRKLAPLAPVGLSRFGRGDLVSRMVEDVDEMQNLDLRVLPAIVQSAVASVLAIVLTAFLLPGFTVILSVCLFGSAATAFAATYLSGLKSQRAVSEERATLYSAMLDAADRAKLLVAFGWSGAVEQTIAEQNRKLASIERKSARATGIGAAILVVCLSLTQFFGALFAGSAVESGTLSRVLLAGFVLVPASIFEFYQLALPAAAAYVRYRVSKSRIDEVLQAEPSNQEGGDVFRRFQSLRTESASVTYPNGLRVAMPDFELSAGESIALVGASGSGKSSLASALVGFVGSQGVALNELPLSAYTEQSRREIIGLTTQNPAILIGTVAANLRIAKPDATDGELTNVLERVGLWGMLQLREGLETEVGQDAAFVSGGEASRLAFARLLLGEREVVIFDEPTAALDRDLGHRLMSEFLAQSAGKTVVLITHDPDLADLCQRQVRFSQPA